MRHITIGEVLGIYQRVMQETGGLMGIRDLGALESAIAQPYMTFDGNELYPSLAEKAAALGFSLIQNHPFADGNKRTGHAAMESFLAPNDFEINASTNCSGHNTNFSQPFWQSFHSNLRRPILDV